MKLAYVHNLPLECYPPATNFLDLVGRSRRTEVRVFTTCNRKQRPAYQNGTIKISRSNPPDPSSAAFRRLLTALWWHVKTALSLYLFRPDVVIYIEPHSAIAAWLYYRVFRGSARLFIHHHEYYEGGDCRRPGMRIPRLGRRLEYKHLFSRAEWISQTNRDRLNLARAKHPGAPDTAWQVLPNFPPACWARTRLPVNTGSRPAALRLIYIGSASFHDTYIAEIVRWAAAHAGAVSLHIAGYNISRDVWQWLEQEQFVNVTTNRSGYAYKDLPHLLRSFDVGLVMYKGNTTNFIYNVPNKVFEYLVCGLEVWYPREMTGIRNFQMEYLGRLREVDFAAMDGLRPESMSQVGMPGLDGHSEFTAERAFAPLLEQAGLNVG